MASKVKRENFVTVQGWMIEELKLKGNDLLVYAIIFGFSQSGEGQKFTGSLQYLADWCNSSKAGIQKNLKNLLDKGLIQKEEKILNGIKFCSYWVTELYGMQQSCTGMQQSCMGGMQQSFTNNIDINNIANNIGSPPPKPKEPKPEVKRHKYGEYKNVLLSDEDLEKLKSEFSGDWEKRIENLSSYMASKGKTYKNHLATIRNWARKDEEKKAEAKKQAPKVAVSEKPNMLAGLW